VREFASSAHMATPVSASVKLVGSCENEVRVVGTDWDVTLYFTSVSEGPFASIFMLVE
jgi:hypothetical protein